jgi:hypothetical protein
MPIEAHTGLCYFSLPTRTRPEIYSFYRSHIFPIAEANGFNPITAEDVISPGENYLAKIAAIIDRSEVVVADLGAGTSAVMMEANLAFEKTKTRRILIVAERETLRPPKIDPNITFMIRPAEPHLNSDIFLEQINNWFRETSRVLFPSLLEEPLRLLNNGEYRAAVISAMTALEATLREKLESAGYDQRSGVQRLSLSSLLKQASEYLTDQETQSMKEWIAIRNKAVHSNLPISGEEAKAIVDGVQQIIARFRQN